jgi:peptidyl-prolyl cis-trans isomerase SurA
MQKLIYSATALFLLGITPIYAQTLFTVDKVAVAKSEFVHAYEKNKGSNPLNLKNYLDLYINFKLKVKAAQDAGIDKLPQIKTDLENFKEQLATSSLTNNRAVEDLINEAKYRAQRDVAAEYFLIPFGTDTALALKTASEVKLALQNGSTKNEVVQKFNAAKILNVNTGFLNVFSLPYAFESILYKLKPNEVSEPFKTSRGFALFKYAGERRAMGLWKVAQILFTIPKDATPELLSSIKSKADSVYALIESKKMSFGEAAKLFSDDRTSNFNNGELAEFGSGKYEPVFEQQIMQLQQDSAVSKPFETKYGFHIVKRISATVFDGAYLNSTEGNANFKEKVLANERVESAREKFASSLVAITKFIENKAITKNEKLQAIDYVYKKDSTGNFSNLPLANKVVASFGKTPVKGLAWYDYIRNYKLTNENPSPTVEALWKGFKEKIVIDNYKTNIESYSSDIKLQLAEFKEGNMLFEIMEQNVWGKANQNEAALKDLYNKNKEKYLWNASANVMVFNSTSAASTQQVMKLVKDGMPMAQIVEQYNGQVQADSGRYELEQVTIDNTKIANGAYSSIISNSDGSQTFIKYLELYPAKQQRSFADARGLLVNDYQQILEQQWIAELKKKYTVKLNDVVWKQLQKEQK